MYAQLEVRCIATEEVIDDETKDNAGSGQEDESNTGERDLSRLVATRVVNAHCECQSGAGGTCTHVSMMLHLVRLLGMSPSEIREFDPLTVTGRQCKWILDHCKGGREAGDNIWWGKTLPECAELYREMRDPKGQGLDVDPNKLVQSRGVIVGDRFKGFDPHPSGGRWAASHASFKKGDTISERERDAFGEFFSAVKTAKAKERSSRSDAGAKGRGVLASDILPAKVRKGAEVQL